ncbi:hypothetical protein RGF97_15155 [Streptomyces roseicoloratus]|uniref:Uncharacterized protein n=1 Tax=Streptomyces roseicoloratus TaxID=2508722 RepID=A0ABY9RVA2_9ACTN|nr:hypothetical protein [Streptomyces roseicoloratus]WMX45920.1 hypothetical protein RGF97_15155 [Streptomyces roseicoloratus]
MIVGALVERGRGHSGARGDSAASPDTGTSFDTFYAVNPQAALAIEAEKMKTFKKRVDDLLIELGGSEAAPGKVGDDRLACAQLGSGDFGEAQFLFDSYTVVHDELEKLSRALETPIEGTGLAVHSSRVGYENVDHDIRDCMKEANAEVESHYNRERNPFVEAAPTKKEQDKETGF